MFRKKRSLNPFGLAFLDVMSCGFGAAVLIFMLIKHNVVVSAVAEQAGQLETFHDRIEQLAERRNELAQEISSAQQELFTVLKTIAKTESRMPSSNGGDLDALKKEVQKKQLALRQEKNKGEQLATISNDGKRQYLTGLHIEGDRIVILFDSSASMLDDDIVNIIRNKHLPPSERRKAGKWRWGVAILRWVLAHMPKASSYQIYAFNDKLISLMPSQGWMAAGDKETMNQVVKRVKRLAPEKGTNLQSAFAQVAALSPKPSAVYLITDGLPTLAPGASSSGLVTGKKRAVLFNRAVQRLPSGVPVHTILLPTQGDPRAAGAFWGLAAHSGGRFLAPAWDWP